MSNDPISYAFFLSHVPAKDRQPILVGGATMFIRVQRFGGDALDALDGAQSNEGVDEVLLNTISIDPPQKATRNKIGNDIFWNFFDLESGTSVTWQGYDDDHWWNLVAETHQFQVQGRFRLDPASNYVFVVDPIADAMRESVGDESQ